MIYHHPKKSYAPLQFSARMIPHINARAFGFSPSGEWWGGRRRKIRLAFSVEGIPKEFFRGPSSHGTRVGYAPIKPRSRSYSRSSCKHVVT